MSNKGNEQGNGFEEPPPPYGWVKQIDPATNHPFWVDTQSNPPRSIWTHPYEDEQYLRDHPEVRGRKEGTYAAPSGPPPTHRRHSSDSGLRPGPSGVGPRDSRSHPGTPHEKRSFLGKLKDAAIGTKEEREAHKRQREEMNRRREEQRQAALRQIMEQARLRQERYGQQNPYGQYVQRNPQVMYGPPMGNPYYGGGYYGRRRGGGGGAALPLIGGLGAGMLLGGAFADGGDFGGDGGDFGGGDFGGGDFGGGDF